MNEWWYQVSKQSHFSDQCCPRIDHSVANLGSYIPGIFISGSLVGASVILMLLQRTGPHSSYKDLRISWPTARRTPQPYQISYNGDWYTTSITHTFPTKDRAFPLGFLTASKKTALREITLVGMRQGVRMTLTAINGLYALRWRKLLWFPWQWWINQFPNSSLPLICARWP